MWKMRTTLPLLIILLAAQAYSQQEEGTSSAPAVGRGLRWELALCYLPPGRIRGAGHADFVELRGACFFSGLFTAHPDRVSLGTILGLVWIPGDADFGLPDLLLRAALSAGGLFRDGKGTELSIAIEPGVYSELSHFSEKSLSIPIRVVTARQFPYGLVGKVGFVLRPDFDKEVLPILSLGWSRCERIHWELGIPVTGAFVQLSPGVGLQMGLEWFSDSYAATGSDSAQGTFTSEEVRSHIGIKYRLGTARSLNADLGYAFARSMEFDWPGRNADVRARLDPVMFVSVGIVESF